MKKTINTLMAALAGGLIAFGFTSYYVNKKMDEFHLVKEQTSQPNGQGNTFASYSAAMNAGERTDFTSAAELTLNGVVHVKTEYLVENNYISINPFDFFFGYGGTPQKEFTPAMASGSGVIVSADGYIVTNNHVIENAERIKVVLNDQKSYDAKVIGFDPASDLALLKIEANNLNFVSYGNSDEVKVGEWVLAVGNPFNLTSTVTAGIVSAKSRDINILQNDQLNGLTAVESFIQTDAAVNPGNSGGALVNTKGQLIGINTAIKSNTGSYTGYSFAIPVNIVKKVVDDLLEFGTVQRGFIGVSISNIDEELAKKISVDDYSGVYVSGVTEDGAAKEAGVKEGDVILKIGNASVTKVSELQEQVSRFRPGDLILVTVRRGGKEYEFPLKLKNKYGNTEIVKKENPQLANILGANFVEATDNEKSKLRIKNGVKVENLANGKLKNAGVKEGFVITHIDKKPVVTAQDVENLLAEKKGGVLIEGVYQNGMRAYYGFGL